MLLPGIWVFKGRPGYTLNWLVEDVAGKAVEVRRVKRAREHRMFLHIVKPSSSVAYWVLRCGTFAAHCEWEATSMAEKIRRV